MYGPILPWLESASSSLPRPQYLRRLSMIAHLPHHFPGLVYERLLDRHDLELGRGRL